MSESVPERGEIWWVDFEPSVGSEARKTRPAIVISTDRFDRIAVRLVVPLTTWRSRFAHQPNKALIRRTDANGLVEDSAADILLARAVALERFTERIGLVGPNAMEEVLATLLVVVDYQPGPL